VAPKRLRGPIGHLPPAEAEHNYYSHAATMDAADWLTPTSNQLTGAIHLTVPLSCGFLWRSYFAVVAHPGGIVQASSSHTPYPSGETYPGAQQVAGSLPDEDSRRGFVGRAGRFSAAVVLGIGTLLARKPDVAAAWPWCCNVALPGTPCNNNGPSYTCPSGFYRRIWYCCHLGKLRGCGECNGNPNSCFGAPYNCSAWWTTSAGC
jgi:hypothetical protein